MAIGVHGLISQTVPNPAEVVQGTDLEFVTIQHQPMEEKLAMDNYQIHKFVTHRIAQV